MELKHLSQQHGSLGPSGRRLIALPLLDQRMRSIQSTQGPVLQVGDVVQLLIGDRAGGRSVHDFLLRAARAMARRVARLGLGVATG
jgi:hypothetical protein